ncbi:hypothetical protein HZS_6101 [Henneguya salminicola]|nr:hypothetical protein HZS_6101 [Henneguya salminicola]
MELLTLIPHEQIDRVIIYIQSFLQKEERFWTYFRSTWLMREEIRLLPGEVHINPSKHIRSRFQTAEQ